MAALVGRVVVAVELILFLVELVEQVLQDKVLLVVHLRTPQIMVQVVVAVLPQSVQVL
jgi:hypothetical protein